jgi:hypothetical protein
MDERFRVDLPEGVTAADIQGLIDQVKALDGVDAAGSLAVRGGPGPTTGPGRGVRSYAGMWIQLGAGAIARSAGASVVQAVSDVLHRNGVYGASVALADGTRIGLDESAEHLKRLLEARASARPTS